MVAIETQPAAGTEMDPLRQWFELPMATAGTILRRVGRIDLHKRATSVCCFVGEEGMVLRPGRINNAFGQTVIMDHPIDGQVWPDGQSHAAPRAGAHAAVP
jgi:hypothetical protein